MTVESARPSWRRKRVSESRPQESGTKNEFSFKCLTERVWQAAQAVDIGGHHFADPRLDRSESGSEPTG